MSGETQAQRKGQHDQNDPLNLSGIFVQVSPCTTSNSFTVAPFASWVVGIACLTQNVAQVTDLIGSLLPASKIESDHGTVPKR